MEYFKFNNKHSYNDLKIVVKEMPMFRAEKNIESIAVNGRNGNLHIDNGTYKSIATKIDCIITDMTKLDLIRTTLIGTSQLELSNQNGRYYIATIKNQIDFSKYLNVLKEFPLELEIDPMSYDNILTNVVKNLDGTFEGGGNQESAPIITIIGTGTIALNNKEITVTESGITIDCNLMNCTKNGLNKNDKVTLTEFPNIVPGTNYFVKSPEITEVTITYRKKYL